MIVLYATQTGTAEQVAQRIIIECLKRSIECSCLSIEEYDKVIRKDFPLLDKLDKRKNSRLCSVYNRRR
jgi:flavodoxin